MTFPRRLSRCAPALAKLRRRLIPVGVALAGLLAIDPPQGRAQGGFFEELFGWAPRAPVAPPPYYSGGWRGHRSGRHGPRWAPANYYRHRPAYYPHRPARNAAAEVPDARESEPTSDAPPGRRSLCVRMCDGYVFSVANTVDDDDIPARQAACNTLCPESRAKLFLMPEGSQSLGEAIEAGRGGTYASFLAKIKAEETKPQCACHSDRADPTQSEALLKDPTLRAGDSVVTQKGVRVFEGGVFPYSSSDFLPLSESRSLPEAQRRALASIDRVIKAHGGRPARGKARRREPR